MKERLFLLALIFWFSIVFPGIAPQAGAQGDPFDVPVYGIRGTNI